MLKVLDLFSGIGGFSLGLERAGGFETVAFCEVDPFCRKVLAKHWPGVPIYEDIQELNLERLKQGGIFADVITGGFPCQDISTAGKRAGINKETRSGLWSELHRLIGEIRPKYAIVENVAALLSGPTEKRGAWFGRVLGDLAECGYDAEWENIPASAMGAPHRRERVWLVAYPTKIRYAGAILCGEHRKSDEGSFPRTSMLPAYFDGMGQGRSGYSLRTGNGFSAFMGEINGYGNAVVPQIPELIGRAIMIAEDDHDPITAGEA